MKCQKVRIILDQAVEENAELSSEVDAHLKSCPGCAVYYQEQSQLWSALDLLSTVEPKLDFNARLWQRIRQESSHAGWMSGPIGKSMNSGRRH